MPCVMRRLVAAAGRRRASGMPRVSYSLTHSSAVLEEDPSKAAVAPERRDDWWALPDKATGVKRKLDDDTAEHE